MAFVIGIIIAIATLATGVAVAFLGVDITETLPIAVSPLILGWALGLLTLMTSAFVARKNPTGRFEMIVASEVIVVYGITTLVLSIGLGVTRTADVWVASSGPPPLDQLAPAMRTFAEGFIAAGISPFCAVALRQIDVLARRDDAEAEIESVGSVSDELENLRTALFNAAAAANAFAGSLGGAAEKVEASATALAETFDAAGQGGERVRAGLDAAGEAADAATAKFKPAAAELARLGAAADEGATLVHGLRDIIAAVEEFIPRGRSGGRS